MDEERCKAFINNIFCGRWKMAQYVLQLIILYFTASMSHKSFVIAIGSEGNNGKSCLRRCITAIAPNFQAAINKGLVVESKHGKDYKSATNEISNLGDGTRIGFTDELTGQDTLSVSSIKEFTGETEMAFRRNHRDTEKGWSHICCLVVKH